MNKQTKAALAAGAGAILLLGGAGSLAYWNDSGDAGGNGVISSGQLSLDDCTDGGVWTDVNNATVIDINAFRIVPGDSVSYTCATAINATGDNLVATLSVDLGEVAGDADLESRLVSSVSATANGVDLPEGEDGVEIVPAAAPAPAKQPIVVTVTVTFLDTDGLFAQNQTVDLSATTLTLVQNTNPAPVAP